ncbi:CYTH and CHAD domain-containing protein [Pseudarthrobacter sp. NamE5]|uniref:CYTH and CHAD domain-containing protein n=1 Tax=Pseudarthrobacter sp. NamE5 TaxID=2576839 RepID=UPI00110B6769|nr:CYTH and CHAD domain-containing protein [Pseudarthrobacter sp. NamE5]TLM85796.1 CYTH and CHAD domain-containing protein [Pseudarthrobacter sp. NamE5]
MKASQGLEIEKKYEVDDDAVVPPLAGLPGVARVGAAHTASLEAVYFDTDTHALASRRITLRRRTGGTDAGWHLKLPPLETASGPEPQQRQELHAPLGQPDVVPDSLLAHLQVYLRGTAVAPVVRLQTKRTTHSLYGEGGVHLADLADDRVTAERLQAGSGSEGRGREKQQWREWELELVHGEPALFAPAEELLFQAGARPAGHASKLARALGDAAGSATTDSGAAQGERTPDLRAGKKAPATAVVTAYLGAQIGEMMAQDPGVRLEEPDAVHNMRSAARRSRSVLAGYRKLYAAGPVRRLRDELKWLGQMLGGPRDAEVLLDRLRGHLDELPPGEGTEAARVRVEGKAGAAFDGGSRLLQEALNSDRYFRLLDGLEDFRDNPPVRPEAAAPGRAVASQAVDKAARRLRRSQKAAAHARQGTDHENALHQVRKDAKRLRHVAESAALVHGKRAEKVAKAAHRQQKILGDYHDAVIARDLLAGVNSGQNEPIAAEAYAALRQRQDELIKGAEAKYRKARKKSRDLLRRGII